MNIRHEPGRHLVQIPGPSNIPERVLRAMSVPTISHRDPEFQRLGKDVLSRVRKVFKTEGPVVIFPSSGTGAWEAALVNTLSAGDRVLMFETGHFSTLWHKMAVKLGLDVECVPGDWRSGADPEALEARLRADSGERIKAVCVVHNETSTGVTSRIAEIRAALDRVGHPALLLVDTISSLGSVDFQHDAWRVDVSVTCSQKGLMLPPGLGFNAVSSKALTANQSARRHRSYWDWNEMLESNGDGFFPYTPATNMLFGLREALDMLLEEGLDNVFARHAKHAEATRRAAAVWGLEVQCRNAAEHSNVLTALRLPDNYDADAFRTVVLDKFNMSLGNGLGKLKGRVFRIGHLGDFNDLMLISALSGVEMSLVHYGVPVATGGVQAAMAYLTDQLAS